ncbi:MAG: Dabb family protein [Verrucomicrobiota bacterium]
MVHHLQLIKLKGEDLNEAAEELMIEARIRLLKIPEVVNLFCGKRIEKGKDGHDFFLSMEFENMSKRSIALESPIYITFKHKVLDRYTASITGMNFEMEPGKDVNYS